MKRPPMSEAQMAERVVKWLEADGWECFFEVAIPKLTDRRADIVAAKGEKLRVVECKKTFGFELLDQAAHWLPYSHETFIAIPYAPFKSDARSMGLRVAKLLKLGVLDVTSLWPVDISNGVTDVHVRVPPETRLSCDSRLQRSLCPEHKTHAQPGTRGGGQWTPFRATCEALARHAAENPGCTLAAAIKAIDHHYSSDRSAAQSIATWFDKGKTPGDFELKLEAGQFHVYPAPAKGEEAA